jgi:hypothetical protein
LWSKLDDEKLEVEDKMYGNLMKISGEESYY